MAFTLQTELQYVSQIAYRLPLFRRTGRNKWNFRCVICGDSKKKSTKCRGFIGEAKKGGHLVYSCPNCGYHKSFVRFLEEFDKPTYTQLITEIYADKRSYEREDERDISFLQDLEFRLPKITKTQVLPRTVQTIDSLADDHPAVRYLRERQIPEQTWSRLLYSNQFESFCKKPQKRCEPRLVLPCYDSTETIFAAQGRILPGYQGIRYRLHRICGESSIVFGLKNLDHASKIYVVEGPLDSLFLSNGLAICSASLHRIQDIVAEHGISVDRSQFVLVFDNEKRSPDILAFMLKAVGMGYNVCVWPDSVLEKDINDMALAGRDVQSIIDSHTFSGAQAEMMIGFWKRCEPRKAGFYEPREAGIYRIP